MATIVFVANPDGCAPMKQNALAPVVETVDVISPVEKLLVKSPTEKLTVSGDAPVFLTIKMYGLPRTIGVLDANDIVTEADEELNSNTLA